jgi:hypothetical protein
MSAPHRFHFVCELIGCDVWVSTMVGQICTICFGCGGEVAMFGGVVKGSDGRGKTVFSCLSFEVGVYSGFRSVSLVTLGGVRPGPLF